MRKRKRSKRVDTPIEEIPVQAVSEPEPSADAEPEPEVEPSAPIAPAVQTLEGEYLGMRAMKVEEGVYDTLPAWVNVDGYKEGDRVRITVEFERVETVSDNNDSEPESGGVEPTAETSESSES